MFVRKERDFDMKKIISILMLITLLFSFTACSSQSAENETMKDNITLAKQVTDNRNEAEHNIDQKILIAYFSVPENVDINGADAVAGASIVVSNEEKLGNTEYAANVIQKETHGDLFEIKTENEYPLEHEELIDYARSEQSENYRPKLSASVDNFEKYDVIFIGYPNWGSDMPMPVYSFLEAYDFSGKIIVPFITHGGSGASNTINTLSHIQPEAVVNDNAFVVFRNDVSDSENDIIEWLEELGYKK